MEHRGEIVAVVIFLIIYCFGCWKLIDLIDKLKDKVHKIIEKKRRTYEKRR